MEDCSSPCCRSPAALSTTEDDDESSVTSCFSSDSSYWKLKRNLVSKFDRVNKVEEDPKAIRRALQKRKHLQTNVRYWSCKKQRQVQELTTSQNYELEPIQKRFEKEKGRLEKQYQAAFQRLEQRYQPQIDTINNHYHHRIQKAEKRRDEKVDATRKNISSIENQIGLGTCVFCNSEFVEADHRKRGTHRNTETEGGGLEDRCPTCIGKLRLECEFCDQEVITSDPDLDRCQDCIHKKFCEECEEDFEDMDNVYRQCWDCRTGSCDICEEEGLAKETLNACQGIFCYRAFAEGCEECVCRRLGTCDECDLPLTQKLLCEECWNGKHYMTRMSCGARICNDVQCESGHKYHSCKDPACHVNGYQGSP